MIKRNIFVYPFKIISIVCIGTLAICFFWPRPVAADNDYDIKITFLGTASMPNRQRYSSSILVEIGEEKFLFDTGIGVGCSLGSLSPQRRKINNIFFTHLHLGHTGGILGFLFRHTTRKDNYILKVGGPKGTREVVTQALKLWGGLVESNTSKEPTASFSEDPGVKKKQSNKNNSRKIGSKLKCAINEIGGGVVYNKNNIKITAFTVVHDSPGALGYRIDYKGRSVVISGDTTVSDNLIKAAKGADVLIHEILELSEEMKNLYPDSYKNLHTTQHTNVEGILEVLGKTNPRICVFSHIILRYISPEQVLGLVKKEYPGQVIFAEDMMMIELGDDITINPFPAISIGF